MLVTVDDVQEDYLSTGKKSTAGPGICSVHSFPPLCHDQRGREREREKETGNLETWRKIESTGVAREDEGSKDKIQDNHNPSRGGYILLISKGADDFSLGFCPSFGAGRKGQKCR